MGYDYSNRSVCVIDAGNFQHIATSLTKEFEEVFYYSPWIESYPKSNNRQIGEGMEGITRTNDLFAMKKYVDLWVFPDIYWSDFQDELISQGCRVWGSRHGDELEILRDESKKLYKSLGLPVGKYKVIIGLANLRSYLKEHENQYIKVSITRGDFESFYSKNYTFIEPFLDWLEGRLGIKKKIAEFIVEDQVEGVEIGYDGYCIDGWFPSTGICGIEIKDKSYVGHITPYKELPKEITGFLNTISPTLKKYKYKNFLSTENRITKDNVSYMNDMCARCGSPPSESYVNALDNLCDILWFGATGEQVEPEFNCEWIAEAIIESTWAGFNNWQTIQFPKKYRDNIKLKRATKLDNEYYIIPTEENACDLGAVVSSGKTMDEAIKNVKKIAEEIDGINIKTNINTFDSAQEELNKLKEIGIVL